MRHFACLGALATCVLAACATGTPVDDSPDGSTGLDAGADGAADTSTANDGSYDTVDSSMPDASHPVDAAVDAGAIDAADAADAAPEAAGEAGIDAAPEASVDAAVDANVPADAAVDAAPDAGGCTITSCGAQSVCTTTGCAVARRVFVTRATFTAALGGHAGADATCQTLATTALLGGTWMAWISDNGSSPSARFTHSSVQYTLLDGTVVASNWAGLTSGSLNHGIDEDENGYPVGGGTTEVWTATGTDGTLYADGCSSFSVASGSDTVQVGVSGPSDYTWSEVYDQFCNRTVHLYCVEQ